MVQDLKTEIKGRVLAIKDLPTLPKVLDEVSKLVEDPNSSTDQIARAISRDQVLASKVLKMVNSPIYGFPGRISSIQHALVLLGFNVIRGIIISTSVFDMMAKAMDGLWEHSVGAATAAAAVARAAEFDEPDEYSVVGLLHDLGKVVSAVQMPDVHKQISDKVAQEDLTYFQAERDILGFGHDRINAWLGMHWGLPANIREGMSYHHYPERAEKYPKFAAVAHMADFMVRVFEYGNGGDDQAPPLSKEAMKILGFKVRQMEKVMDELSEKFIEISDLTLD